MINDLFAAFTGAGGRPLQNQLSQQYDSDYRGLLHQMQLRQRAQQLNPFLAAAQGHQAPRPRRVDESETIPDNVKHIGEHTRPGTQFIGKHEIKPLQFK